MSDNELHLYDGELHALGMNISISDIVGNKIVEQWMAKLSPEDINLIEKAIEEELFDHNYNDVKYFKKRRKDPNSSWGREEDTPVWKMTQTIFQQKYTDFILKKIDELLATETYQQRAERIANDIIDYALEGYKNDMKARIKERLVDNVVDKTPSYGFIDLRTIIQTEIQNQLGHNNGY